MNRLTSVKNLKLMTNTIRQDIITMLAEAGSGHPGGALGLADVLAVLYFNTLKHNPKKPKWEGRDRLILSPGHVCPVLYSAMARSGYFPIKKLMTLRKLGSKLQGHPSRVDLPALELSTASLGQGLGVSVGMALAVRYKKKKHTVYCITSDGEHDEGSTWEAINAAQIYKLDNLINIIDRNKIQLSGDTKDIWPLKSLKAKYRAFNWKVFEIDGHNIKKIISTIKKAKKVKKPVCIIANTTPGKGVSFMENQWGWHGHAPKGEEVAKALLELQQARRILRNK